MSKQPSALSKIVSGGQTGVDRAALDWALENDIPHGGWCPRGRRAEDGRLHRRYSLRETDSSDYSERTKKNVEDTDGTLIINSGDLSGGTAKTASYARSVHKPLMIVSLDETSDDCRERVLGWMASNGIRTLNVAGPRESKVPDIYNKSKDLLNLLFDPASSNVR
jgi:hypothetical protein